MARNHKFQTNFSGGVFSPSMYGRTEMDGYGNAMKVGKNIIVEAAGGVKRRPGTLFIREYRDLEYVRLFPFRFNTEQEYLIVMYEDPVSPGSGFIDIYKDNVLQTQIASPYGMEQIKEVDYAQSADTMVLTQGEIPMQVLRRLGADNNWELIPAPIINPPQTCDYADPPVCTDTWTAANGYPKFCTFHTGRLWTAGSRTQPQSVWGSVSQDFFNFDVGTGDPSDSVQDILDTDQINPIVSIYSERALQIFTTGAEFTNTATLITPTTSAWKRQSNYGSYGFVDPVSIDGGTLFLDRTGRTIRQFVFNDNQDGYTSDSISLMAEHLIVQPVAMGVLRGRTMEASSFVFVVNRTGTIAVLNLMQSVGMAAWTEWITQGNFKDIVVVGEETFILVERAGSLILEQLSDIVATDSGAINQSLTEGVFTVPQSNDDNFFGVNYDREGRGQVIVVWGGEIIYKMDDFKNNPLESVLVIDERFKGLRAFSSNEDIRRQYFADREYTTWFMYSIAKAVFVDAGTDYITGLEHLIGRSVSMVLDGAVFPDEIVIPGDELPGGGHIKTYPDGSSWKYNEAAPQTYLYQEKDNATLRKTDGYYEGAFHPSLAASDYGFQIGTLRYLELGTLRWRDEIIGAAGQQEFSANGTFTVPLGVTNLDVMLLGGGGSGGVKSSLDIYSGSGSGGHAGGILQNKSFTVTPGQAIAVGIGAGGTSIAIGLGTIANGRAGAATTFGSLSVGGGAGGGTSVTCASNAAYAGTGNARTTIWGTKNDGNFIFYGGGSCGHRGFGGQTSGHENGGVGAAADFPGAIIHGGTGGRGSGGGGVSCGIYQGGSTTGAGGSGFARIKWDAAYLQTQERFQTRLMVLEVVDLPATDGVVPVPRPYKVGEAGLWFGVEIETMPISIGQSLFEPKRIISVTANYKNTAGLTIEGIELFNKNFGAEMLDRREPTETGIKKIRLLGYNRRTTVQIRQDVSLPMTLLSLDMEIKY